MLRRVSILFLSTLFFVCASQAQTKHIDSLRSVILTIKDPLILTTTTIDISESFYDTLIYPDSSYFYADRAYNIALENDFKHQEGVSLAMLGMTFNQIYEYDEALIYFKKARTTFKELEDSVNLSIMNSNIAGIYFDKSNYETAINYYEEAIEISKKEKDTFGIIIDYMNLGECEYKLNRYDTSKDYLEQAIELMEKIDVTFSEGHIYYGNTLLALDKVSLSIEEGTLGLDIAQKENDIKNIAEASELLYRAYEAEKNYEKAITHHDRFLIYKDSLNVARERNTVEKSKLKFNLSRKEKELTYISQKAKYVYLIYGLIGVGIVMIIFLIKKQQKISVMTRDIRDIQTRLVQREIDEREKANTRVKLMSNFKLTKVQDEAIKKKK